MQFMSLMNKLKLEELQVGYQLPTQTTDYRKMMEMNWTLISTSGADSI